MPEHVLFAVSNYPPHLGGVELHVHRLARELVSRGHRVTVVVTVTEGPSGTTDEDGVRVIRIRGRFSIRGIISFPRLGTARWLGRLSRTDGVTVLSTHTRFFPMSVVGARAASLAGVFHEHTEHGSDHVQGVGRLVGAASRLVDGTFGRRVLRSADLILAVSDRVQDFVRRLAAREAVILPNAIDVAPWVAARDRPHASGRRLVYLGRLVPGKGWDDFLECLSLLNASGVEFSAQVIGDGPDRRAVDEAARALGLGSRLTIRGRVVGDELGDALAGATLVNASKLAEGFQTSLIEAVAAGGEVVTYPIAGAADLAAAGAPVQIVGERTPAALAGAIASEQAWTPMPREELAAWDWSARADEFLELVVSRRSARRGSTLA